MDHIKDEIRVEAPIEHVWTIMLDPKNWEEWDPRTTYSDLSGPLDQVGTTFTETSRMLGFEMKSKDEVVEVEPHRLLHIRSDGPTDMFLRFEKDGDATRVEVETEYQLPAYLPGFIKNLMTKRFMERYMRQALEVFKAQAELKAPVPA